MNMAWYQVRQNQFFPDSILITYQLVRGPGLLVTLQGHALRMYQLLNLELAILCSSIRYIHFENSRDSLSPFTILQSRSFLAGLEETVYFRRSKGQRVFERFFHVRSRHESRGAHKL